MNTDFSKMKRNDSKMMAVWCPMGSRSVVPKGAVSYSYDVQGRLVFKDAPHGGDYLWDNWRETKVKRLKG